MAGTNFLIRARVRTWGRFEITSRRPRRSGRGRLRSLLSAPRHRLAVPQRCVDRLERNGTDQQLDESSRELRWADDSSERYHSGHDRTGFGRWDAGATGWLCPACTAFTDCSRSENPGAWATFRFLFVVPNRYCDRNPASIGHPACNRVPPSASEWFDSNICLANFDVGLCQPIIDQLIDRSPMRAREGFYLHDLPYGYDASIRAPATDNRAASA
jgi:hypothetical protein